MGRKKRKKLLILSAVVLVAVAVAAVWAWPAWRRWEAERLLARYRAAPDVATATKLMKRLRSGEVDEELGGTILGAIYNRVAVVRESYQPYWQIWFAMETTNPVPDDPTLQPKWLDVFDDDWPCDSVPWNQLQDGPRTRFAGGYEVTSVPAPSDWVPARRPEATRYLWSKPPYRHGLQRISAAWVVQYDQAPRRAIWSFLLNLLGRRKRSPKQYLARADVTVDILVVPRNEAQRVAVRRDPALDKAIRAGIQVTPEPTRKCPVSWETGSAVVTGGITLTARDLPIGCVFHVRYVGAGPERYGADGGVLVLRPGADNRIDLPQPSVEPSAVDFNGKVVLTPDPESSACPGIKSIWGGTLEFPLRYAVRNVKHYPVRYLRAPRRSPLPLEHDPDYPIGPFE